MVTVYVLQSTQGTYRYVGITKNLKKRFKEHNLGKSLSTKPYGPYKIVYTEEYPDYAAAREREKFLKSGAGRNILDSLN